MASELHDLPFPVSEKSALLLPSDFFALKLAPGRAGPSFEGTRPWSAMLRMGPSG